MEHKVSKCGNNMPTRCNRWFLLQILLLAQHVSGRHHAHHQELEIIIQVVAACGVWCLVFKLSVWCGAEGCVSGLRAAAAAAAAHPIFWRSILIISYHNILRSPKRFYSHRFPHQINSCNFSSPSYAHVSLNSCYVFITW